MEHYKLAIHEIPWDRIVHWHGRATQYPEWLDLIKTGTPAQQQEALSNIKTTIEHQDGIIYVTPIALPFVYDLLTDSSTNKKGLLEIIESVLSAVKFQHEYFELADSLKKISAKELIEEKFLWPAFIDDHTDDILWEEYANETQYWLGLTTEVILGEESKLKGVAVADKENIDLKNKLLEETKKLKLFLRNG